MRNKTLPNIMLLHSDDAAQRFARATRLPESNLTIVAQRHDFQSLISNQQYVGLLSFGANIDPEKGLLPNQIRRIAFGPSFVFAFSPSRLQIGEKKLAQQTGILLRLGFCDVFTSFLDTSRFSEQIRKINHVFERQSIHRPVQTVVELPV